MGLFTATVLGFSAIILICLGFFIYFLFSGLDTSTSRTIDAKPKA